MENMKNMKKLCSVVKNGTRKLTKMKLCSVVKNRKRSFRFTARWRKLCSVVKNRKRRFRFTANLPKRSEAEDMKRSNQVAKESATIVRVAKWGRSVFINILKFVQFQLTVNVVALIVNFSSACVIGGSYLGAVQLLWVNVIMDTLGALALEPEPPTDDLMKRKPVGRGGSIISNVMWRNIFGQALYQLIVIWILQAKGKTLFELDGPDADLVLNTLIFNSFVFCQVFNEISSREMEGLNVFHGVLGKWVFIAVMSLTVVFQVILIEFLGSFASTIPLGQTQWFLTVLIGFLGMPVAMLVKLIPLSGESNGYKLKVE